MYRPLVNKWQANIRLLQQAYDMREALKSYICSEPHSITEQVQTS